MTKAEKYSWREKKIFLMLSFVQLFAKFVAMHTHEEPKSLFLQTGLLERLLVKLAKTAQQQVKDMHLQNAHAK